MERIKLLSKKSEKENCIRLLELLERSTSELKDYFNKIKLVLDMPLLIELLKDSSKVKQKMYMYELKKYADNNFINYDLLFTTDYRIKHDEPYIYCSNKLANFYQYIEQFYMLSLYIDAKLFSQIYTIQDNTLVRNSNFNKLLDEHFTLYTKSEKQNTIYRKLSELQPLIKELNKQYGIYFSCSLLDSNFNIKPYKLVNLQ